MSSSSEDELLSEILKELKVSKGINESGSFQKLITVNKRKTRNDGFYLEVDPEVYQQKQIVPIVIPSSPVNPEGSKSYTPKGYPETPKPEDFGILEPERLISARSNTPGLEVVPYTQQEISTFVRDVRKLQRKTEDRLPENPTTKEARVKYLRNFFDLGPEGKTKKPAKRSERK